LILPFVYRDLKQGKPMCEQAAAVGARNEHGKKAAPDVEALAS
jgi:hypothetical protein